MSVFSTRGPLNTFHKSNPVSAFMIVIVTLAFLAQLSIGINQTVLWGGIRTFESSFPITPRMEFWRFFTAIFLHGSLMHYLFNTFFGLFIIGAALERLIGPFKYAVTLLVAGIGASAIVYGWDLFSYYYLQNNEALIRVTIGASGAIFGTMGFLFYLTLARSEWFTVQDISSIRGLLLINIIFSFFGGISTSGHFGGLIVGFLIAPALVDKKIYNRKIKGFENPYEMYNQEDWGPRDFDEIEVVDDDDDDDRRIW